MTFSVARWTGAVGAAACALALVASAATAVQQPEVAMVPNAYEPAILTVPAGTAVRFVNKDTDIHTASQRGGGFDSGLLFAGEAWTYVFNTPGTYEYFCLPHPWILGTVVVE